MNLLSLQDIHKQYDNKVILKQASLNISQYERIAVIGQNGSGKSSLLQIIAGKLEIDGGERIGIKNLKILSLEQKPIFKANASVQDVLIESMSEITKAHNALQEINNKLSMTQDSQTSNTPIAEVFLGSFKGCVDSCARSYLSGSADAQESNSLQNTKKTTQNTHKELLDEYARLSAFLDDNNGWDLQKRAEEILEHFGLQVFRDRLANSLSGGEQKKIALASILLQPCDILLLDEPTNHLDTQMVAFLENFILKSRFTLVFISHDRYFIDRVATRIIEIDCAHLTSFDGGYLDYLAKKEEMLRHLSQAHQKLLKILKSEEQWLRQGVKARLKRNEGRKNRILAMREEAKHNPSVIRKMRLELEREQKSFNKTESVNNQKCLFEIEHLCKSVGGKILIKDLNLRILRNDKIAIVGKNGSGKSSFLKILLGQNKADSGVVKVGDIRIGYFDQHTALLEDDKDLLETFCPNGGEYIEVRGKHLHVYGYLKNFLFPKEFLTQKIGSLSGGEKNRVALALLFTKEVDVFILDEPTNDLDIQTINIIEEYLLSLNCAVVFVSHDRYFVDKLAQKLLVFEGGGKVVQTHMLYSEYLEMNESLLELDRLESLSADSKPKIQSQHTESAPIESAPVKKAKKLSYNEQRALQILPKEIEVLESRQKALQTALSNPQTYQQQGISVLATELAEVEKELDSKITQYLELEQKNSDLA
ncbi:ABC-F family ATP-binding cassette domain-containing protein [uncultured Helicobacter sp.]|uniref:ABC-F family ATP-binding cassette domain-containing protein n=1 Tax=uncultured Helicobacter sp. TaxID=175537 RepID=UPI0025CF56FF|nr:ABC-F family ATP-binding cassette domain-containing protein [uncultured Helicobacter sp.]